MDIVQLLIMDIKGFTKSLKTLFEKCIQRIFRSRNYIYMSYIFSGKIYFLDQY